MIETGIRVVAVSVFLLWTLYWLVAERSADREKPKTKNIPFFHKDSLRKLVLRAAEIIIILQLLGLSLFQIKNAGAQIQLIGLLFVIMGACIAISARRELGINWAHAFEYQVKNKQELVTSGVYAYIRHPIYTGLILGFIGAELVAKSYLALLGLILIAGVYHQAKLEEKLLVKHFGENYKKHMKQTKMFIPFLW